MGDYQWDDLIGQFSSVEFDALMLIIVRSWSNQKVIVDVVVKMIVWDDDDDDDEDDGYYLHYYSYDQIAIFLMMIYFGFDIFDFIKRSTECIGNVVIHRPCKSIIYNKGNIKRC